MALGDAVEEAISKCPFLGHLQQRKGPDAARTFATQSAQKVKGRGPIFEEDGGDLQATFRLFHGPGGVVPLARFAGASADASTPQGSLQLTSAPSALACGNSTTFSEAASPLLQRQRASLHPLAASAASISLSFRCLPGPDDFLRALRGQHHRPKHGRKGGQPGPEPDPQPSQRLNQPPAGANPASSSPPAPSAAAAPGQCPLRGLAKPLGGLLAISAKDLKCPAVVVQARAAVARMKPVRELRPRALPVKLLAVGAFTGLLNLPCGVVRQHLEKFSPGWFVAVHASIPFVAFLRKGVMMPKWAIALTFASAVAGQILGGRIERYRLSLMDPEHRFPPPPAKRQRRFTAERWKERCAERRAAAVGSITCTQEAQMSLAASFLHSAAASQLVA